MAKVTKTKIGRVMLLNKGTYNVETDYSELDVVKESGRTYICLKNCKGIQPTNTEYWILAADIGISPTNKEDYNTEEEKSLYANELSDYGKIALDEYTAEKVEQLIAKEVELEGVLDTEKDKQIGIVNDKAGIYNANVETKTLAFNTNASDKTAAFDTNAETKISAFNTNASEKTSAFNANAESKTSAFNANAESKTSAFNTNASEKTARFNQNASDKVAEFDDVKDDLLGQADDLFDALTTNEASGNEIYIDDAKPCRILNTEIGGMYQQETTTGAQLFNYTVDTLKQLNAIGTWAENKYVLNGITFTINTNLTIGISGTATRNATLFLMGNTNNQVKIPGKYICVGYTTNNVCRLRVINYSNGTHNLLANNSSAETATAINLDTYQEGYIGIFIPADNTISNATIKPILSNTATTAYEQFTGGIASPNPDYPQEIEQVESVKLNINNKNLFNKNIGIVYGKHYSLENGELEDYASDWYQENYINAKPNTTYSISVDGNITGWLRALEYDANKNFLVGHNFYKFTTDSRCRYLRLSAGKSKLEKLQLEIGEIITEYSEYDLFLSNIDLKGNKLCAISNTIKDKLLIDRSGNVALQKNVNKISTNESTFTLKKATEAAEGYSAFYSTDFYNIIKMNGGLLCNYFQYAPYDGNGFKIRTSEEMISDGGGYRRIYFRVKTERLETDDESGYKKFLTDNNIIIYHLLETPELIDLGQLSELPKTFNGINNIWAETNLGNTQIEIEYVQDVKKLLEQTQAIILNNASEEVTEE